MKLYRKRRYRVPMIEPEDDGMVMLRGQLVSPAWAEWNAQYHLEGFDTLPKRTRDRINYADTPEEGARPTRDLVKDEKQMAVARAERLALELLMREE